MSTKEEENAESTVMYYKRCWNNVSTKVLLSEFKKYYSWWRTGKLPRKKLMWEKVAEGMAVQGHQFTADQVENRFKTLQRSYRRSNEVKQERRNSAKTNLSEIFIQSVMNSDQEPVEDWETNDPLTEESNDESQDVSDLMEKVLPLQMPRSRLLISPAAPQPTTSTSSTLNASTSLKQQLAAAAPKTSVDVLLEIKDLMRKIELRRQERHEQYMKAMVDRNEILKRKNELVEQLLYKETDCKGDLFIQ